MEKKYIFIVIAMAVCLIVAFTACTSSAAKDAYKQGVQAIEDGDYETALEQFQIAEQEGYEGDDFQNQLTCLKYYCAAQEALEAADLDEAERNLGLVNTDAIDGMEESTTLLRAAINVRRDELAQIDSSLEVIKNLIENGEFEEAEKEIEELKTYELSEEQEKQLDIQEANLTSLSTLKEKAKTDSQSKVDQTNTFSSVDAYNNAVNYISKKAAEDDAYMKYIAMNNVDGPYTDESGNKFYTVPVAMSQGGVQTIAFYLDVYANGNVEESVEDFE